MSDIMMDDEEGQRMAEAAKTPHPLDALRAYVETLGAEALSEQEDALCTHVVTLEGERAADRAALSGLLATFPKCKCGRPSTLRAWAKPPTYGDDQAQSYYCAGHVPTGHGAPVRGLHADEIEAAEARLAGAPPPVGLVDGNESAAARDFAQRLGAGAPVAPAPARLPTKAEHERFTPLRNQLENICGRFGTGSAAADCAREMLGVAERTLADRAAPVASDHDSEARTANPYMATDDGAAPPSERPAPGHDVQHTCITCGCCLLANDALPHCMDCSVPDESEMTPEQEERAQAFRAWLKWHDSGPPWTGGADLESLRADRALLARYGAVLALPYLPAHAEAYCAAINAVGAELGERALALAAQGRGKGDG